MDIVLAVSFVLVQNSRTVVYLIRVLTVCVTKNKYISDV